MNTHSKQFTIARLSVFTLLIAIGILLMSHYFPDYIYRWVWIILLFFFVLTSGTLLLLNRLSKKNSTNFLTIYFGLTVARLFISILFAAIFILVDKAHVILFAANFMILYLLSLGFEIYGIMTNLRLHSKKGTKDA